MTANDVVMGSRLRQARKAVGLTQAHVADGLGMARTTLVAIEKGERPVRPDELADLQALYGVSLPELQAGDPPPRFDPDDPRFRRLMLITPSGEAGTFAGPHDHPGLAWVQIEGSKERRAFSISELVVMNTTDDRLTLDSLINSLHNAALFTCAMGMILEQIKPEPPAFQQRFFEDLQQELSRAYTFFYGMPWESLEDYVRRGIEARRREQGDG